MDKVQLFTYFAEKYRHFLYKLYNIPTKGIMSPGTPCYVEDPEIDITHGDVIHPCVRYIEEGFEGHKWWMVYTPLYAGKDSLENPRLCYADAEEENAPTEWTFYCMIKDKPEFGYNSDPTILFKDDNLYIFWRECKTPKTKELGCSHAVMGCYVKNKKVIYLEKPIMTEKDPTDDKEVCPTLFASDEKHIAYAMHLCTPMPKFIQHLPGKIGSFIYRHHLLAIAEGFGLYDSAKSRGIAIWESNSIEEPFYYSKTVQFGNVKKIYQPWHMDLFAESASSLGNKLYAIVQSSIKFADICLAWSDDREHFCFFKKPLLTSQNIKMSGLYKPTGLVVNGIFYLYYTARDSEDRHLNKLFVTSMKWNELLNIITK